jgi:hypothetical protein
MKKHIKYLETQIREFNDQIVGCKNEQNELSEKYYEALEEATIYKHMIRQ